ncbi:MAG: hypothetical protein J6K42_07765 [Clostridia bacterium]|nr:hypothetical protein [Clostridia bacterium]
MSKNSMTHEELVRYWKYRKSVNDAIGKDNKDNKTYEKLARRNNWIKKIKLLNSKGYTSQEIYQKIGAEMKKELGCDSLKTIERFCKSSNKEQNKDDDIER